MLSNILDAINNMMNNKCWYNLNIDISNAIRNDWGLRNPEKISHVIKHPEPNEIFNLVWLKYMESLQLPIEAVTVFFKKELYDDGISSHVDIDHNHETTLFGYNWVYGGKGSKMVWYDLPDDFSIQANIKSTTEGGKYCVVNNDNLHQIDECIIGENPVLVRVNLPHSIKMGSDPRLCISARGSMPQNNWEDLTKYLINKNLIS
jgi:hypothetical protein